MISSQYTSPNLKEAVRITDTNLTADFFTFANFYKDKTRAPDEPGPGYEITRHYVQGQSDIIFDRLHYYPETGFVFYDGIENGDSEYDGEWYTANPEIRAVFQSAVEIQAGFESPTEKKQPVPSAPAEPVRSRFPILLAIGIAFTTGLAALLASAAWRRKTVVH